MMADQDEEAVPVTLWLWGSLCFVLLVALVIPRAAKRALPVESDPEAGDSELASPTDNEPKRRRLDGDIEEAMEDCTSDASGNPPTLGDGM